MCEAVPANRLLEEHEWRSLGVVQSRGWVHYGYHVTSKTVWLFRRRLEHAPQAAVVSVQ
jgi:cyclin-dependent kinase regulatory subunit CKS1